MILISLFVEEDYSKKVSYYLRTHLQLLSESPYLQQKKPISYLDISDLGVRVGRQKCAYPRIRANKLLFAFFQKTNVLLHELRVQPAPSDIPPLNPYSIGGSLAGRCMGKLHWE